MDKVFPETVNYSIQVKFRSLLEMTKPKVVLLILLTALVGMFLAPVVDRSWLRIWLSLVGIGCLAGAGAAFNHILDQEIDKAMCRTHQRPLPQGKVNSLHAVLFAGLLTIFGFTLLYTLINPLTAWLTGASLLGYAFVYTLYLKRATSQNIVIGGLAGATPPLLGWTSMTGSIHPYPLLLVMIIFAWTPPHFWALAVHRVSDYRKASLPMLPVTHGLPFTKQFIFLYTIILAAVCLLPYLVGMSGELYLVTAIVLNTISVKRAWQLKHDDTHQLAMPYFYFSIVYLLILFVALLIDHALLL
jgi:heme o synthase